MRGERINPPMPGSEVREARELLGLTQQELAEDLELESKFSKDAVRAWESGKRVVPGPAGVAIRLMVKFHNQKLAKKGRAKAA